MKADIVLKSNAIYPGKGTEVFAGGVAIAGNKILAVRNEEEIEKLISDDTKVYEYEDKLIMPGFIDAHDHVLMGATVASDHLVSDIEHSTSEQECLDMIKTYADSHPDEQRILGMGWFPAKWGDAPLPTKERLDEIVPDRPAYMLCADAHTLWLNSLGLADAGYTPDMKFPAGGVGLNDAGEMNGLIFEPDALVIGWNRMYDFEKPVFKDIMAGFMDEIVAYGVTTVGEMSADDYNDVVRKRYGIYKEMDENGELKCRINSYMKLAGYTDFSSNKNFQEEFNGNKFRISGLKGFLDGVTSTYTGYLLEPYTDRPDTCGEGVPSLTQERLNASVIAGNKAGLPVRIHCIAGGSVRMALDAYEASKKENGDMPFMNTIEHIETMHPDDIPRFSELDVIASVQPAHLPLDDNEKITRMGEERCRWEWPFRSLIDAGAVIALGTDCPVVSANPFPNIYAGLTRCDYDGVPTGVDNGEYMTMGELLEAYTLGAAKAYNCDDVLGTLEEGKLADITVIDRNLFDVEPKDVIHASALLTISDGKVVYEK